MSPLAPVLLMSSLVIAAPLNSARAADLKEGVLATVNGNSISSISVKSVVDQINASGENANPETVLNELINLEVLTQAAKKIKLDEQASVAAAIQLQYNQTMANAYLANVSSKFSFTEADLRAEYAVQSANAGRADYKVSHILVDTQAEAEKVISQLISGEDFEAMAKIYSQDPSSETGGDLGWMQGSALPPEFVDTTTNLNIGDFAKTAVKTEYGFHIIKLTDRRMADLPEFETVEQGLRDLLARKALAEHLDELREAADIKQ